MLWQLHPLTFLFLGVKKRTLAFANAR